ncbi:MAG: nucleotidyltransferase family protein [Sphingopyxis solisilvae]|uniref:nucleotidyltransferase family protein n=1 Tax=Sphingopyxis solisilvae TaxID=1886788 RepID=UPI00403706AD
MTAPQSLISSILQTDTLRWHLLGVVAALGLPDCWIAAGFIRNAIWDHLHRRSGAPLRGDVDVIWFDPERCDPAQDRKHEARLHAVEPSIAWSVKNQARMHVRNGDAPYRSATDAMRYWPETATAIAARRLGSDICEIAAPFGVDDLLNLLLRPTSHFAVEKRSIYEDRIRTKGWLSIWPHLRSAEN